MEVRRSNPKRKYFSIKHGKSVNFKEYISGLVDKSHVCENCQENYGYWSETFDMYICGCCAPLERKSKP